MGETTFMHRVNQKPLHDLTRKTEQILGIAAVRCAEEGMALKLSTNRQRAKNRAENATP